jgi:hypothetical protein
MTAFRIDTDRLTITGLAIAALLPFLAMSPAKAAPSTCTVEAQAVRSEASAATGQAATKALRLVKTAEAICAEGNRHEAAKKFALARQQLGLVQLAERR